MSQYREYFDIFLAILTFLSLSLSNDYQNWTVAADGIQKLCV